MQTSNVVDWENRLVAGYTELVRQAIVSGDLCKVEYAFIGNSSRKNIKDNQGKYSAEELHHLDWVVEVYKEHVHNNWKTGDLWQQVAQEGLKPIAAKYWSNDCINNYLRSFFKNWRDLEHF